MPLFWWVCNRNTPHCLQRQLFQRNNQGNPQSLCVPHRQTITLAMFLAFSVELTAHSRRCYGTWRAAFALPRLGPGETAT